MVADGIIDGGVVRFLILEDETRLEFSLHRYVVKFSPVRMKSIHESRKQGMN